MRRCCCCVSVHAGSVVLGLLGVVLAGLELAVLIPYLMDVDPDEFNPIQGNLHRCFYFVSKAIQDVGNASKEIIGDSLSFDHNEATPEKIEEIVSPYMYAVLASETAFAATHLLMSFLMTVGVCTRQRCLMIPYLVIQMIVIILFVVIGICATVFFFLLSVVMGCVSLGVLLVSSFLFCYFWSAVHKAFLELGANRDYMYAPAPVKPIYNPMDTHKYHPSAPQHFNLE